MPSMLAIMRAHNFGSRSRPKECAGLPAWIGSTGVITREVASHIGIQARLKIPAA